MGSRLRGARVAASALAGQGARQVFHAPGVPAPLAMCLAARRPPSPRESGSQSRWRRVRVGSRERRGWRAPEGAGDRRRERRKGDGRPAEMRREASGHCGRRACGASVASFLRVGCGWRQGQDKCKPEPEVYGNWNAPEAVTTAAVIYCLRCLVDVDIPLNQGCLALVKILIPKGSFLSPSDKAVVVGGNVLTSQRVTDVILMAFQACACSQGCMNNLTFGNAFGYYETIGGGCGAGPT
ncbi:unnamed protein product [Miscanthus lutarioriparius]|uniref:Hydantoinase B/oxoprolinase domain-containing protein n=1 Tax=Miscanthus lutarioriparius TaxID=422564 RepID=A0A811MS36_9POAL|nr:unnamed protein product [Miscanthus lutarioriparius]